MVFMIVECLEKLFISLYEDVRDCKKYIRGRN